MHLENIIKRIKTIISICKLPSLGTHQTLILLSEFASLSGLSVEEYHHHTGDKGQGAEYNSQQQQHLEHMLIIRYGHNLLGIVIHKVDLTLIQLISLLRGVTSLIVFCIEGFRQHRVLDIVLESKPCIWLYDKVGVLAL